MGGRFWLGDWTEWGSVVFLSVMLGIAVWSAEQAKWITPQPSLLLILILALVTGLLLVKSQLPTIAAHALAVVLGAGVALWQAANLLPELGMTSKFAQLIVELQAWWQAANFDAPSPGTIQVALMFGYLTWLIGYVSIWFILRRHNPWVAISLGTVGILINLSNLMEKNYGFFFFYLLAALFLVAQTTSDKHYSWFRGHPLRYPQRGMRIFLVSVFCLSTLTLSLAWLTPEIRAYSLETLARTKAPWRENIESYWRNFFAAVKANKPILSHGGSGTLRFEGTLDLSDQILFVVNTAHRNYWRTQTYDIYTSRGWLSSITDDEILRQGVTRSDVTLPSRHSELTYTVKSMVHTDVLLTTGELVSSSIPVTMSTFTPLVFNIEFTSSAGDSSLPSDIASWASTLRAGIAGKLATEGDTPQVVRLEQSLPVDLSLVDISRRDEQINGIRVTRRPSGAENVIAFSSPRSLSPNRSYAITTQVSTTTPAELSEAGENYPQWVTDRYLQLPADFPERIRQLAENITKDAKTPYAKAMAIRNFLSFLSYSLVIDAPPPRADGVEYFLFTQKTGYCTYFASAAVVMLRSVGVPTRVSVGYLPGQWDTERQISIIRDLDFHAWPEIYFPGYGWIEVEVTPGRGPDELEEEFPSAEEDFWDGDPFADDGEEIASSGTPGVILPWTALGILGITALTLMLGLVSYRWLGGFIGLSTASAVYAKMCLLASLVKLGPQSQQTALEYSAKLSAAFPQHAGAIGNIAQAHVTTQYSLNKTLGVSQKQRLQESWHEVRRILLKRLFRMK